MNDGAFLFQSRDLMIEGANSVLARFMLQYTRHSPDYETFARFGLQCHDGSENQTSKTEAILFPGAGSRHAEAGTSDFAVIHGVVHYGSCT